MELCGEGRRRRYVAFLHLPFPSPDVLSAMSFLFFSTSSLTPAFYLLSRSCDLDCFFYEFFCLCVMFVLSFLFSFWQLFALSLPIITMSRVTFGCALYAFYHQPQPICPSQQSYKLLTTHFTVCIHISYPCVYHFLHSMCVFSLYSPNVFFLLLTSASSTHVSIFV